MAMRSSYQKQWLIGPVIGVFFLGCAASCSSIDEAPGGGRVEHPTEPKTKTPHSSSSVAAAPTTLARPLESADVPQAASMSSTAPAPPDTAEPKLQLSPLEQAIANDHPSRPWSQHVPKRACTKDEQCGDGFCDRGKCAAIWTGSMSFGQRCGEERDCGTVFLCMEGRCRSCVSDLECKGKTRYQDPKCEPDSFVPGAHECYSPAPSIVGGTTSSPVPSPKK